MVAVHQFLQSFVQHDAISTHTRHLQKLLREMGLESEIYAGEQRAGRNVAHFFRDFDPKPGEQPWILYHLSTATPLTAYLLERPEPVATDFHNITPVAAFAPWEPHVGNDLQVARLQYRDMAARTTVSLADSQFNADEMQRDGYPAASVAPILFDPADFSTELDPALDVALQRAKASGGHDWLFVGRIAPNKAQHDIIKAFALYRHLFDPEARLHLVGGSSSHRYLTTLQDFCAAIDITAAVNITGGVSNGELGAYYKNADVFVSLSDHEGFGVPLLEAMHHDIPVVAFGSTAVPETVGRGGLVLDDKSPGSVALAVNKVLGDATLQTVLRAAGHHRVIEMSLERTRERWRTVIESQLLGR